jgi:hypothetical protein
MPRDVFVILLFVGGMIVGAGAGVLYYRTTNASLISAHAEMRAEFDRLKIEKTTEQEAFKKELAEAADARNEAIRDLDIAQMQLNEQAAIIERQRKLIAQLEEGPRPDAALDDSPEIAVPSRKKDGVVNRGAFVYRGMEWQQRENELEIVGELENRSEKHYGSAIFHIELFDEAKRPVDRVALTVTNFSPGRVVSIKEYTLADRPEQQAAVSQFRITAVLLNETPQR